MNDTVKKNYDRESLLKDITDRQQMIRTYQQTGYLDRNHAISKILELRQKDIVVMTDACMTTSVYSIPAVQASDQSIIQELQRQKEILTAEYLKSLQ